MMNKIIILNGPNLNLLGEREKEKYGNITLKNIEDSCKEFAKKNSIDLTLFQSNIEGELVEKFKRQEKSAWINHKCWWIYSHFCCHT